MREYRVDPVPLAAICDCDPASAPVPHRPLPALALHPHEPYPAPPRRMAHHIDATDAPSSHPLDPSRAIAATVTHDDASSDPGTSIWDSFDHEGSGSVRSDDGDDDSPVASGLSSSSSSSTAPAPVLSASFACDLYTPVRGIDLTAKSPS